MGGWEIKDLVGILDDGDDAGALDAKEVEFPYAAYVDDQKAVSWPKHLGGQVQCPNCPS